MMALIIFIVFSLFYFAKSQLERGHCCPQSD